MCAVIERKREVKFAHGIHSETTPAVKHLIFESGNDTALANPLNNTAKLCDQILSDVRVTQLRVAFKDSVCVCLEALSAQKHAIACDRIVQFSFYAEVTLSAQNTCHPFDEKLCGAKALRLRLWGSRVRGPHEADQTLGEAQKHVFATNGVGLEMEINAGEQNVTISFEGGVLDASKDQANAK